MCAREHTPHTALTTNEWLCMAKYSEMDKRMNGFIDGQQYGSVGNEHEHAVLSNTLPQLNWILNNWFYTHAHEPVSESRMKFIQYSDLMIGSEICTEWARKKKLNGEIEIKMQIAKFSLMI